MFQSEKNVKRKDDDIFQACEIKIKFTNFDKKFLKDDGTEFTLLDPFNRPYTYITVFFLLYRMSVRNRKNS